MNYKYLSNQAIDILAEKYNLEKPDAFSQDWILEVCDTSRVEEWIKSYEKTGNNNDEKFALMALILCSFNEALDDDQFSEQAWNRIASLLIRDSFIQQHWIHYWCSWDHSDNDLEDAFALTPRMRELKLSNPDDAAVWFSV